MVSGFLFSGTLFLLTGEYSLEANGRLRQPPSGMVIPISVSLPDSTVIASMEHSRVKGISMICDDTAAVLVGDIGMLHTLCRAVCRVMICMNVVCTSIEPPAPSSGRYGSGRYWKYSFCPFYRLLIQLLIIRSCWDGMLQLLQVILYL